jgi:hypothetical protein
MKSPSARRMGSATAAVKTLRDHRRIQLMND